MGNGVNWLLVIGGLICVILELALGALTGLDLALVYLALFRSWLKSKLTVKNIASNVDAVVGKTGVVTKRIAPSAPGLVKVGAEIWRAELAGAEDAARDLGAQVTVQSVEGVTLKVR